ncbi:purine nucleoside phosphorylase-like [Neocloeon triangulifer]|uniref:purine nucleoside phosphorylase-like n=1 Tax=Neocloeon triangulifer TaxID=2078957 RepID=UPI00286F1D71|nr:purine nucleoside phosphorylase-like [Neocloeon triangulifer]
MFMQPVMDYPNTLNTTYPSRNHDFTKEKVAKMSAVVEEKIRHFKASPTVGIICGSGLGEVTKAVKEAVTIAYKDIPGFPRSTVQGHAGQFVIGYINEVLVVCMQGRFHFYEGYDIGTCCMPIKLLKLLGCHSLIISNAAGGLNPKFNVGDIMVIHDHINLMGFSGNGPLVGPNDEAWGPRFLSMHNAYSPAYIKEARDLLRKKNLPDHVGVYTALGGPQFETVAELRLLQAQGVDAVGMSTVHEVVMARYLGLRVFSFSLITNKCPTTYEADKNVNHQEVIDTGREKAQVLVDFVRDMVPVINSVRD